MLLLARFRHQIMVAIPLPQDTHVDASQEYRHLKIVADQPEVIAEQTEITSRFTVAAALGLLAAHEIVGVIVGVC